jgi:hypothetical protein
VRKKISEPMAKAVKESGMTFFVFEHPRPRGWSKTKFFFREIPNIYAKELEIYINTLESGREQFIFIKCDRDFNKIAKNGTKKFLFRLLKNLGTGLAGVEVSPPI